MIKLGGGGYTIRNVSRCWTYETSIALGVEIANELPYNDYFEYFGPDFKLHISPSNMTNLNTQDYLDKVKNRLFENLRMLPHAPGVQVQSIPEDALRMDVDEDENDADKDVRAPQSEKDKRIIPDNEYSDSEDEGPTGDDRKHRESHKNKKQKTDEVKTEVPSEDTNGNKVEKIEVDEKPKEEPVEEKTTTVDVEMKENGNEKPTTEKEEEIVQDTPVVET